MGCFNIVRIMKLVSEERLDNISYRLADEAAKKARDASEEAQKAGEKAAKEAERVASEAIAKVEKIAKDALQLAELLNSAIKEASSVLEKRLSKKVVA